jgi:4-carboxymuconolactone decarboxylase
VPRIEMPALDDLTGEQRRVHDEVVAGLRGRVPAPMRAWIASPELAQRAQHLGEFLRYETSLPPRLSELAILVTARHWTSHFEWFAHKKEALAAGLDPAAIDAIAQRREPQLAGDAERVVYAFARRLHETHGVDDALYGHAVALLGERAVVELVGLLGYYTLVSMTLNTFEIGLPEGTLPELEP